MRKFAALLCMASLGITFASDVEAANYGTRQSSTNAQKKSRNPLTWLRNRRANKKVQGRSFISQKRTDSNQNPQIAGQNADPQQGRKRSWNPFRRKRNNDVQNPQMMEENQNAYPSQYGAQRRTPNDDYDEPNISNELDESNVGNGYETDDEGGSEAGIQEKSVKQTKKKRNKKNKNKKKRKRNSKKGKKRNRANRNNEESWKHEIPAKKRRRVALDLPSPFVKKSDIKLVASNNTDNKIMITKGLTATPLAPTQSLEKINAKAVKIKREHKMSGNEATRLRQELNMYRELLFNSTNTEKTA